MKKFVSWNVNGIRACINKGFIESFDELDADIFCIQESKLQKGQLDLKLDGYHQYWHYALKKGYAGTAIFSKEKPLNVTYGIGSEQHDSEGRAITAEFDNFFMVTVYTPNAQEDLRRLEFRMDWEDKLREYLLELDEKKPVILCGDLNVAHKEIDLKNPKPNAGKPGFSDEERFKFSVFLESGFTDTFRYFYEDLAGAYSWWSYRFNARANNAGWRIDYFCVSKSLEKKLIDAKIHGNIFGSDHCPVEVTVDI
ncbi:MAG: exodeoxyribonuclease III [Oscillospiraceae bacterium]|jgi:exodeoxyribonuclease-3|nr:exodeoxyribonuclease III [Oscillospiraceae bacterium]